MILKSPQGGFLVHFSNSVLNDYFYEIYDKDGNFVTNNTDEALSGGFYSNPLIKWWVCSWL